MKLTVFLFVASALAVCRAIDQGPWSLAFKDTEPAAGPVNLIELADRLFFYNFLSALEFTNLTYWVRRADSITLFVPTNAAFDAVPQSVRDFFAANPKALQDLLRFHIVQGMFPREKLRDEDILTTWDDNLTARFNIYNHTRMDDISLYCGAVVVDGNYSAGNGYLHVINQLLDFNVIPRLTTLQLIASRPEFAKLTMLINAANATVIRALNDTSNPHTLFAPNDVALAGLPPAAWDKMMHDKRIASAFVLGHVTQFGSYYPNGVIDGEQIPSFSWTRLTTVTKNSSGIKLDNRANILSTNASTTGVVHTLDAYLIIFPREELQLE